MSEEAKKRYVKLNSGAILVLDDIVGIVRKEINQYAILSDSLPGIMLGCDAFEAQQLEELLNVTVLKTGQDVDPTKTSKLVSAD